MIPRKPSFALIVRAATITGAVASVAASAAAQLPEWRVDPRPALVIGPEAGVPGEFTYILSAARLGDGSVAVVSRGTQDIRIFDPRGAHVRTFGRKGAGPGEYEQPFYVGRAGDTLFIYDYSFHRVTALDATTGAVRTWRTPRDTSGLTLDAYLRLANGTLVAMPVPFTSMRRADGTLRRQVRVVTLTTDSTRPPVTIGQFPFLTSLAINPGNRERATSVGSYDFGPSLWLARSGDLVVVGDAAEPRLQYFTASGTRAAEVALPLEPRSFDLQALAAARDRLLAVSSDRAHQSIINEHEPRYLPKVQPYFRELRSGPNGEVWVERFRVDRFAAAEFLVVGDDRKPRARAVFPPNLRPYEIGHDYVLGVTTDDDGVESVVLHRYRR